MITPNYTYKLFVRRVIDGDTIVGDLDVGFEIVFKNRKFRLHGIDTPELNSKDEHQRSTAQSARDFVAARLIGGTVFVESIKLPSGSDLVDSFGRYLVRVYYEETLNNWLCMNEQLIRHGLATIWKG